MLCDAAAARTGFPAQVRSHHAVHVVTIFCVQAYTYAYMHARLYVNVHILSRYPGDM